MLTPLDADADFSCAAVLLMMLIRCFMLAIDITLSSSWFTPAAACSMLRLRHVDADAACHARRCA